MLRASRPFFCAHHVLRTSTTKKLWSLRREVQEMQLKFNALQQSETTSKLPLFARTPSETAIDLKIPLETEIDLRDQYRNPIGDLRFGKLLEDLDAAACTVAVNHANDTKRILAGTSRCGPANIVTASVERIDLINRIHLDHNLAMKGKVLWVGNASMLVGCELWDEKLNHKLLQANFLLVAVDAKGKPIECNPLQVESEEEKNAFKVAEEMNEKRRASRKALKKANSKLIFDLQNLAMNEETLNVLREKSKEQETLKSTRSSEIVPMKKTVQVATHLTQPQDANTGGKIFGGYLMQKSFEIAWISAFCFFKCRPKFVSSDDIAFHRPVPAGSICVFTATVSYVHQPSLVEVSVQCEIMNANTEAGSAPSMQKKLTNTFEFVFTPCAEDMKKSNAKIPNLECEDYEDWIKMIRGKAVVDDAILAGKEGKELRINQLVQ